MAERQLHLFTARKPLADRLGEAFFRAVPRVPGVYIMTGREERVLYVGQSGNLRSRLASYKNARPDRAPRKVIRLIHAVDRITWETCESAEGARLRENELLRLYRPQFNRVNTWPAAYAYIRLQCDGAGLELALTRKTERGGRLYGAFKARAVAGYASMLRLMWAVVHQPTSPCDFPVRLLGIRPPSEYRLDWKPRTLPIGLEAFVATVEAYLSGASDDLVPILRDNVPQAEGISPFQLALHASDLEVIEEFYRLGPRRLYDLSRQHRRASALVSQAELDDLMV